MEKKKRKRHYVNNRDLLEALIEYRASLQLAEAEGRSKPKIPNYIGECIILICNKLVHRPNFRGYCVDHNTQALTQKGWVYYDQIFLHDDILSVNPESGSLEWTKVSNMYINTYNGKMFKLNGCTIDALVTPGHKFLTLERGLQTVETLGVKDHLITMGKPLLDKEEVYTDTFVELVGWYVTEGSIENYDRKKDNGTSRYIRIYQSKTANPHKCYRIQRCIDHESSSDRNYIRRPHKVRDDGGTSFCVDRVLSEKLFQVAPNKVLSLDFIFSLTQKQRLLLIETMFAGDGHGTQYFQKDKNHVDNFLILCVLAGYNTHLDYKESMTEFGIAKGYILTLSKKTQCIVEKINMHGGRRGRGEANKTHQPTEDYNGVIWCPTTKYGNFVCRRGSRVYVTGNSYAEEFTLDGIENCVAAVDNFDPAKTQNPFGYFTQIAYNAFVRRLLLEKKQQYIKHKNFTTIYTGEAEFNSELSNDVISSFEERQKNKQIKAKKKSMGLEKFIEKDNE